MKSRGKSKMTRRKPQRPLNGIVPRENPATARLPIKPNRSATFLRSAWRFVVRRWLEPLCTALLIVVLYGGYQAIKVTGTIQGMRDALFGNETSRKAVADELDIVTRQAEMRHLAFANKAIEQRLANLGEACR